MKIRVVVIFLFLISLNAFSQEHPYLKFFRKSLQQGKILPSTTIIDKTFLIDEEPKIGEVYQKKLHNDIAYSMNIHPTQTLVATGSGKDKKVQIFDYQTKEIKHTFSKLKGGVRALLFSPDGQFLVAGTWSRVLYVWNIQTGELVHQKTAHTKEIKSLAFTLDEKYLATGSSDNEIIIWDFDEMNPIKKLKGHTNDVNELLFTRDKKYLISASDDKKIIVWDWQNEIKFKELTGHTKSVKTITFDEDNQYLLSGGNDKKVIKWNAKTFEKVKETKLPYLNIHQLSIDKSAAYFIRCGKEYQIELYNYQKLEELQKMVISKRGILKCGFSHDNQYLIGCNYNGQILVAPINLPYPYASVLLEKIKEHPTLEKEYNHLEDTLLTLLEKQVIQTLDYLKNNGVFPAQQQLEEANSYIEYMLSKRQKTEYLSYQKQLEVYLILVKKENEKYQEALTYFETQKQQNPTVLINFFVISQIYEAQNQEEKQKAILAQALTIQKNWKVALVSLGNYYLKKGNVKQAESYFDKIITYHPSQSIGYQKKGEIYFHKGDFKNTELYLKKALQKDTNQSSVYFSIGNLAFERGLYDDASQNYQKAIDKNPSFSEAHWKIAEMKLYKYEHHLRFKSYLKDAEKIVRKYPNPYLNAKIWLLNYHYLTAEEYGRYGKGKGKERSFLLDSAFFYVQLGEGEKNQLLKKEIFELQGKRIPNTFFSSPILNYQFLLEKGLFTEIHEKKLLQKVKEKSSELDYYVILLKYYYQNNAKKFNKLYTKTKSKFPSNPLLVYEYIKLVGQHDVKKIQSLINEGLKADKKFSHFYEIRANLKKDGTKRFDLRNGLQVAYDSVQIYEDYIICFYPHRKMMYKDLLGQTLLSSRDYRSNYNSLNTPFYEKNRWSYYVNFAENWNGKYGLSLNDLPKKAKKYHLVKLPPIVPPIFDTLFLLKNGAVIVELNGQKGLYHLDIGEVLPSIYKKIYLEDKHCIFVQTAQNKWGVMHWNGELLLNFEYDNIRVKKIKNVSVLEAILENKTTYFNYSGEEIKPFKKNFSFTKHIKGKIKSVIGYDEYADFADDYSLHHPVEAYIYKLQDSIFCMALLGEINKMRLKENLPPFLFSKALYYASNHHAKDMAEKKFFEHKSKIWYKETLENRIAIDGGEGYKYDEVLFKIPVEKGKNYKEYIEEIVKKQMANSTTRKQLTSTEFSYLSSGTMYDFENQQFIIVYNLAQEIIDKKINPITFKWTSGMYENYTYETFALLPEIHKKIDVDNMNYELLNAAIFYETNRQRLLNGGTRYLHSPKLEAAAFMHSKDMIEHNFFDHQSILAGKKTVGDRYRVVGAKTSGGWGENIHGRMPISNYTYHEVALGALNSWMNSPGHRKNILNEGFKFIGCGAYINVKTNYFKSTQNFTFVDKSYRKPKKMEKESINSKKKKKKKKKKRKR